MGYDNEHAEKLARVLREAANRLEKGEVFEGALITNESWGSSSWRVSGHMKPAGESVTKQLTRHLRGLYDSTNLYPSGSVVNLRVEVTWGLELEVAEDGPCVESREDVG